MEPTAADLAAVSAVVDNGQPAPTPNLTPTAPPAPAPQAPQAPAPQAPQQQPTAPTQQPAPSQAPTDPFASLFASQPTEPTAPVATPPTQPTEPVTTPQPQQPTEPTQPAPQVPTQPVAPAPQVPAPETPQSFDDYMNDVLKGVPQSPVRPDPEKINPNDPNAIKGFFDDMFNVAKQEFQVEYQRSEAIKNSERQAWDGAFDKYGSLRTNKPLRDMVHAIRRAEFAKGLAITPTQAADRLLDALKSQYQQGAADSAVISTIEQVQPNGGGGTTVPTTMDTEKALLAVQTGGEEALAQILDAQIKAGTR